MAGWTKEETQARVKFPDLGPVDVGQEYMLEYVETLSRCTPICSSFTHASRRGSPHSMR